MKKIAIICTIYNEEKTIRVLLESLVTQTFQADEIIICDGGSNDTSQKIISDFIASHKKLNITLLSKIGNRSSGRNAAIARSNADLIAITDAGCIPEKSWLEEMIKTYESSKAPVVAGYYKGLPSNAFEEAVVPYVLVMPDKINENIFLPATRSMMIEKKVWSQLGGFDEKLTLNEDYPFAKKIKNAGIGITFSKKAVAGWMPRKNIKDFSIMISRFAQGDIEAGIFRPKVLFLFFRYLLLLSIIITMLIFTSSNTVLSLLLVLFVLYSLWSIQKNIRYTKRGWYWLPILQYVADYSVIKGSLKGIFRTKLNYT